MAATGCRRQYTAADGCWYDWLMTTTAISVIPGDNHPSRQHALGNPHLIAATSEAARAAARAGDKRAIELSAHRTGA